MPCFVSICRYLFIYILWCGGLVRTSRSPPPWKRLNNWLRINSPKWHNEQIFAQFFGNLSHLSPQNNNLCVFTCARVLGRGVVKVNSSATHLIVLRIPYARKTRRDAACPCACARQVRLARVFWTPRTPSPRSPQNKTPARANGRGHAATHMQFKTSGEHARQIFTRNHLPALPHSRTRLSLLPFPTSYQGCLLRLKHKPSSHIAAEE